MIFKVVLTKRAVKLYILLMIMNLINFLNDTKNNKY